MNLSNVSPRTLTGRALRYLAYHAVPPGLRVPILRGPARGKRWLAGAHCPACWLGCYEYDKQQILEREVHPGSVVFDVGAHRGFFTLVASSLTGPEGRVISFEPLPLNQRYLHQHLRLNHAGNVTVIEAAVSDTCGTARFHDGSEYNPKCISAHLATDGEVEVKTVTLDSVIASGQAPAPDVLKIDVEGAEMLVLRGAQRLLETAGPTLVIDTHGRPAHEECCAFLAARGYQPRTSGEEIYVLDDGTERYFGELFAKKD